MGHEYITYRNCLLKHLPALPTKDHTPALNGPVATQLNDPLPFPPKPWGPGFHKSLERGSEPTIVDERFFELRNKQGVHKAVKIAPIPFNGL